MKNILKQLFRMEDDETRLRRKADDRIRRNLARILSKKLETNVADIYLALKNSERNVALYAAVQNKLQKCVVTFDRQSETSIEMVMDVEWSNGEHTIANQKWVMSDLPLSIRQMLDDSQKTVEIDWNLPSHQK